MNFISLKSSGHKNLFPVSTIFHIAYIVSCTNFQVNCKAIHINDKPIPLRNLPGVRLSVGLTTGRGAALGVDNYNQGQTTLPLADQSPPTQQRDTTNHLNQWIAMLQKY